jgi:endoglycosylceramidase
VILHGVNVESKVKAQGYIGDLGKRDFAEIRGMGMNCIRLTIIWDGFEPQPGKIDYGYLDKVARLVSEAKAQGLYVLLDMHQDLYSVLYSDGAPEWATLAEGKKFAPTKVWSFAYFQNDAVQTALDNFWANKPAPDGVPLQEHYARVWQEVARRFVSEPAVVGYDLMNEPPPGRDYVRWHAAWLGALAEAITKRGVKAPKDIEAFLLSSEAQKQVLPLLSDIRVFAAMADAGEAIMQNFERTYLMPLYTHVAHAIRQVDKRHLLFLESNIEGSQGVRTAITPFIDANGKRDPQQAYTPHCYDVTTDVGPTNPKGGLARVWFILDRHQQEAERLQMPMLIGEWGAYYLDGSATPSARFHISEFERLHASDTYWSWDRKLADSPLAVALMSPAKTD